MKAIALAALAALTLALVAVPADAAPRKAKSAPARAQLASCPQPTLAQCISVSINKHGHYPAAARQWCAARCR